MDYHYKSVVLRKLLNNLAFDIDAWNEANKAFKALDSIARGSGISIKNLGKLLGNNYKDALRFARLYSICPKCERELEVMPLNTHSANQVGGDYTFLVFCPGGYSEDNDGHHDKVAPETFCDFERYFKDFDNPCDFSEPIPYGSGPGLKKTRAEKRKKRAPCSKC